MKGIAIINLQEKWLRGMGSHPLGQKIIKDRMAASASSGKTEQMEGREHGKRDFSSAQGSFLAGMRENRL